jgi:F0F1-type ATP synthase assembly protein I
LKKRTQFGFESQNVPKTPSGPDKHLIWLGKYLSLALTLPASVFAGYLLGAFADHFLHHPFLRALGIMLGMAAGVIQILRELSRESRK